MYIYKRFKTSKWSLTIILITLALVAWGVLGPTSALLAGKGGKDKTLHLNVTFKEDGGERIMSDGYGPAPYTYYDGEDNVLAIARDRFRFDNTKGRGRRKVTLDFSGTDVEWLFGQDPIEVEMDMRLCFKYPEVPPDPDDILAEYPDFDGMPVGSDSKVTMCIHFSYNGDSYGLAFGNLYQFTGEVDPGTDPVSVTRTGDETWTIEAPPDAIAGLHSLVWKEGSPLYGYTEMPFMVTLEVQEPKGGKKAPPAPNLSSELTSTWGRIKAER